MLKPRKLNQLGDTIVEVMISLVVVALAIGLGYGVATRSLKANRQAQERVEALKKVEGQIERLKKRASTDGANSGIFSNSQAFCLVSNNTGPNEIVRIDTPPLVLASDALSGGAYAGCIDGLYHISISPKNAAKTEFNIAARWFSIGSNAKEETLITYRIYPSN